MLYVAVFPKVTVPSETTVEPRSTYGITYVNDVGEGTEVIVLVPAYLESEGMTISTTVPTVKPCAEPVVRIPDCEVTRLLVIEKLGNEPLFALTL